MDLLKLFSLKPQSAELENGETVYLKRLAAADRVEWLEYVWSKAKNEGDTATLGATLEDSARLLVKTLCDNDSNRLFADNEDEEKKGIAFIKLLDYLTVEKLTKTALRINGVGSEGDEDVKKKSATLTDSSTSSLNSVEVSGPVA